MKFKQYALTALLGVMVALPAAGYAESGDKAATKAEHREQKMQRMVEELGLNKKQEAKLKAIHAKYEEPMRAEREKVRAAHDGLDAALRSNADDAAIRERHAALQAAKDAESDLRFQKLLEVRAILTPEQREKFKGSMDRKGSHRGPEGKGESCDHHPESKD